jgi:hypothetical protein
VQEPTQSPNRSSPIDFNDPVEPRPFTDGAWTLLADPNERGFIVLCLDPKRGAEPWRESDIRAYWMEGQDDGCIKDVNPGSGVNRNVPVSWPEFTTGDDVADD